MTAPNSLNISACHLDTRATLIRIGVQVGNYRGVIFADELGGYVARKPCQQLAEAYVAGHEQSPGVESLAEAIYNIASGCARKVKEEKACQSSTE